MGQTVRKNAPGSSKTFPIVVSIVVVAMIAIVVLSIMSNKSEIKAESKLEFSPSVSVVAASLDGKLGETKLPSMDQQTSQGDPAVGMIVPQITAQDFKDETVTLTPGEKPYAIAFLAHWCPVCQREVPALVSIHEDGDFPDDVEIVAVATATSRDRVNFPPSQWLLREDWPWRKIADDENSSLASAFGLTGYPYIVFVNADGTISSRLGGEQDPSVYISAANAISQEGKTEN